MASATGLTPAERTAFQRYFEAADTSDLGVLTGELAVAFFAKSQLPPVVLGEIWGIADEENDGFLSKARFDVAARLIGHAQRGESVTPALASRPGLPPYFQGVNVPSLPPNAINPASGASIPSAAASPIAPQPTGTPSPLSHIKPTDRSRFLGMFTNAGPEPSTGLLAGDKARDILLKSKLPFDTLSSIWSLADTQGRGALDSTDFVIGMHLTQQIMAGAVRPPLPTSLPPGLYDAAAGRSATAPPVRANSTAIPRQLTGNAMPSSPLRQSFTGGAFGRPAAATAAPWAITAAEKAQFDGFYDTLDTERRGVIDGAKAVPFFMDSQLGEVTLAQIWELADIRQSGQLNRDEFAVAMRLIHDKLGGKDVPATLPAEMIPPALRGAGAGAARSATMPAPTETQRDLFSLLDEDEPAPVVAPVQPTRTGVSAISPQPTGRSLVASPPPPPTSLANRVASPAPMHDDAAVEVGNLHAQLASTQSSLQTLQQQRGTLDDQVGTSASQLASLQTQLAAAKAAHSTETAVLESLRTRAGTQASELKTTRESLITAESDLSALRVEKAELEGQLMRDREETRALKDKLRSATAEADKLKLETEAMRKEARQNKGLGAISRKQVERAEEVRDRARSEHEEARKEAAAVVSPAPSTRSLNPFDRMRGATSSPPLSVAEHKTGGSIDSTLKATAVGAGVGAIAAGVGGAAVLEHHERATSSGSKEAASDRFPDLDSVGTALPAQPTDGFDSAFADPAPTTTTSAAPAGFESSFDDAFADPSAATSAPAPAAAPGFDDAFDSPFVEPAPVVAAPKEVAARGDDDSSDEEADGPEDLDAAPVHHDRAASLERPAVATPSAPAASPFGDDGEAEAVGVVGVPALPGAMPSSPGGSSVDEFTEAHQIPPPVSPVAPAHASTSTAVPSSAPAVPASAPVAAAPASNGFDDDFDREFDDLTPATTATAATAAPTATVSDFDAFDAEFDSSFAPPAQAASQPASSSLAPALPPRGGSTSFDDAFASFDAPSTSTTTNGGGSGFDNSFGAPPPSASASSKLQRQPSGAQPGDTPDVGTICALGFSRGQAVQALEKNGYSLQKAINALLDSK